MVCAKAGARAITLWNRTPGKAEKVAEEIGAVAPDVLIHLAEPDGMALREADVLIQSTSLGMKAAPTTLSSTI